MTGARQVGKSTLLKNVFADRRYVSLDDPFMEQQAREAGDMFLTLNPPPVTIDEVQRAKELFRYIKIKCDESEERGLFCLSGSQPFHLMQSVSESIEENGILYPIEIKKNTEAKAIMASAFSVLDQIPGKKRGMGAVICSCPDVGALLENVLQIPVWYI